MQVKGRSLNNPPPPSGPVAATQEGPFPVWHLSETVLGFFPKFSGKFSEHFEHFPLLRPPIIYRVSRPSEAFSLLFRTFFVTFRTFFGTFRTFSVTFRAFSVTPSAPFPLHVRTIALQFLELSMLQSHNLSSLSAEPSIKVLWGHPKTSDCGVASQTPIKSEDTISDTFNSNVERTHN